MSKLTFDELRRANLARIPHFKNKHGERAHPKDDGSDWSLLEWCGAAAGELGELSNICKKVKRGDLLLTDYITDKGRVMTVRAWIAREIADVICYSDIIAIQIGADLGNAVISKFNEISDAQKLDISCFISTESPLLVSRSCVQEPADEPNPEEHPDMPACADTSCAGCLKKYSRGKR